MTSTPLTTIEVYVVFRERANSGTKPTNRLRTNGRTLKRGKEFR